MRTLHKILAVIAVATAISGNTLATSTPDNTTSTDNAAQTQQPNTTCPYTITGAWVRTPIPTGNTLNTAAYMIISGVSASTQLLNASAYILDPTTNQKIYTLANKVELHSVSTDSNGVSHMNMETSLSADVSGNTITLAPQNNHIMLMGLKSHSLPSSFFLDLAFTGNISCSVPVTVSSNAPTN
jgi:copper(I)-binding protein